ncbi:hypothetical protein OUZ56_016728 [Daphnia magna]|uniref:Uncharacterized protein n=1 Tax=Daphnia magna TaxID=35525 RepID=A0ABR0ARE1_9CRUS|nr:hypothetical protein OUZ56_016728 [Daphnia magna]
MPRLFQWDDSLKFSVISSTILHNRGNALRASNGYISWAVMGDNVFEIEILESDSLLEEESVLNTNSCDCPYTIHEEYWCNGLTISEKMTQVTNLDLVNYLICSKSPYTHEDLKAYKGLEAYKRFIDGGIGSLCVLSLLNKYVLLKAKVLHSMSINDTPAQPWAAFNAAGVVIAGHCNCTAGKTYGDTLVSTATPGLTVLLVRQPAYVTVTPTDGHKGQSQGPSGHPNNTERDS